MVEQGLGNVSLSQSRSSSFYLEVGNNKDELKTRLVDDFADTPTDSPDDEDHNDENGLRRKQSSSSSLFFRNKLQDSLNSMNQQQQQQPNPIFKIGDDDDDDDEYVQQPEFNLNIGEEFLLPSRLLQTSISGDSKLNNTVTAPINMKKTQSYMDPDDLALSSTLKESNMIISSSSSSGSSGGENRLENSLGKKKKNNNSRKRRQKKRESQTNLQDRNTETQIIINNVRNCAHQKYDD